MVKRYILSALLALMLVVGVLAPVAAKMKFCFEFNGKEYCIDIPVEYHFFFRNPPPDLQAVDISHIKQDFAELYRTQPGQGWLKAIVEEESQSQWYLVDAAGKHVVVFDMSQGAAVEVPAETQIGY